MPFTKTSSRALQVLLIFLFLPLLGYAQGVPWYTIPLPVPNGFVDAQSGNVHLEIPLGSMPQRNGDPIISKIIYDTTYYTYSFGLWNANGTGWRSSVGSSQTILNSGYIGSGQSCTSIGLNNYPNGTVNTWTGFWFQDIHGTKHPSASGTPYQTRQVICSDNYGHSFGTSMDITSFSATDQDLLGYSFQISNYNQMIVYAPDGSILTDTTTDKFSSDGGPIDPNGNIGWPQGSQPNLPVGVLCGTSTIKTSSGSSATYTGTCTNQNVSDIINGTTYTGTVSLLTGLALPDGTSYSFSYDTGTTGNHNGNLLSVTLPTGGTLSFTYVLLTANPSIRAASATFNGNTWNLTYAPGLPSSGQTTSTVLGPPRYDSTTRSNLNDKTVFITIPGGMPYLQTAQYYNGSSTLLRTVTKTYDGGFRPTAITTTLNDSGQSSQVSLQYFNGLREFISQKQETDFTGTVVRTTKTTYTSSNFIKPTSINVYAGSGTGSPIASTLYAYDEYSASYCKNGVPMLAGFTGASQHDDTNFGTSYTSRGNVTTIQRLISGTTYSTSHMCYDTLGNVTQTVDANGNPTSYDYSENWADSYCIPSGTVTHSFPTTITDALGHRTKKSFYTCTVLPQSIKDENDIQAARNGTTFTYELLNRPLAINYPDGGQSTYCYSHNVSLPCYTTTLPPFMTNSRLISGSTNLNTKTLLDSYGRVIQTQLTSDPQGTVYTNTTYDALGHVSTVSNPYRSTSDPTYGITTHNYDALGRTTKIADSDGSSMLTSYSGNCTTVTDEAGKSRQSCTDGLGRLTQLTEDPGSSPHFNYLTTYTYNALDDLLTVVQNGSRNRSFVYDSLSRLTSATNPESGTITYTYDNNGDVQTRTDARTIKTTYSYDALNRLTSKIYSDGTPTATFTYDASSIAGLTGLTNPVGHLVQASNSNAQTVNSYDPMGRVKQQWQCTPINCGTAGWFTFTYGYDLAGGQTSIYPQAFGCQSSPRNCYNGGFTLYQTFNSAGRVNALTSNLTDLPLHPPTLVSGVTYDPAGQITAMTYGNNLTEARAYNTRLQPCHLNLNSSGGTLAACTSATPAGNIQDFVYHYNLGVADNGNITWTTGTGQQSFYRTYTYDSLNRLSTMADSDPSQVCKGLSWNYDPWGNRTAQTVTAGACGTFSVAVNTNNQFVGSPYQYDAAGNMTHDASHSYSYDANGHIIKVDGGSTATYVYDANGRRIEQLTPLAGYGGAFITHFWYDIDGRVRTIWDQNGGWIDDYLYLGSEEIGHYSTLYNFKDILGSTRILTKPDQTVRDSEDYLPFGEQEIGGSWSLFKFTGKERDIESGLDNFGARYNSSQMGRFMTPDPDGAGAHHNAPQSWNAYSYTANNPMNAVDPSGLECVYQNEGNFPSAIPIPDGACAPPATPDPATPFTPTPADQIKPSTACTYAFHPCTPGALNAEAQPNLAAMKNEGPGGYNYGGFNIFGVLSCAAAADNDPTDPGCRGTKLSLTGGMFQGSWSLDAQTPQPHVGADPLDPFQLINLKPTPNPAVTSRSYVCTAIDRAIQQLQPSQRPGLNALQTMYRKSCQ